MNPYWTRISSYPLHPPCRDYVYAYLAAFVCWGCCDKAYPTLGGSHNRNYLFKGPVPKYCYALKFGG